jgi:hypothetical protein
VGRPLRDRWSHCLLGGWTDARPTHDMGKSEGALPPLIVLDFVSLGYAALPG